MTQPGPYEDPYGQPTQVPQPLHPFPEPVVYPQLLRTPNWALWRPVVGAVALLVAVFVLASVVTLPVLAVAIAVQSSVEHQGFAEAFTRAADLKRITPASLLWLNLTLATGTLVVWGLYRVLHGLRPRWSTSVLPGMRWRFFFTCLPIAVIAMALNLVVASLLPTADSTGSATSSASLNHLGGQAIAYALVILLTTPLQAMGEEYVFRGYLFTAIGSYFRRWTKLAALLSVVGTALLFALFHGTQNFPLFFDRFAFGVLAAYLVLKVGGLEAGIALHVLNNFFAYGAALLLGSMSSVLATTEASYWNIPVTVVQSGFYLVAVLFVARRMGLRDRTAPVPGSIGGGLV